MNASLHQAGPGSDAVQPPPGSLPLGPADAEEHTPASRLLLVDDDRLIVATLSDGLRRAGYDVVSASNVSDAIKLVESPTAHIDLAILDVRIPGRDGIELAKYLRNHTSVPFMFLSAYGDVELVKRALEYGGLGYLVKPTDVPQLVPSIEAALQRAREIDDLRKTEQRLSNALLIEQRTRTAVGMLMERHGMTRQEAFEALRNQARAQRRKIGDLAEELIEAAERLNALAPRHDRKRE